MNHQPFDRSISLGAYGYQIIHDNFHKFADQEQAVLQDNDPEPLHQMRVGMRRLRTALQVFRTAVILPKAVSIAAIQKVAKNLGETRDLDVLHQELISHYQPLLQKSERSKFDKILRHIDQERDHSFGALKKVLHSKHYQTLKQSIQTWLDQPIYTALGSISVLQVLPDLLLPTVCRILIHPGWLVGTTMQSGTATLLSLADPEHVQQQLGPASDTLHDLRKQMKGVRYQAEFFSDFYEDSYLQNIEKFKTIQEILGQFQDQTVLRGFLTSILNKDLAKIVPTIDQCMKQDQLAFWQSWQSIQQHYLSPAFRDSLRSLLTTPTPLIATAALD